MQVRKHIWPDGDVSYELLDMTADDQAGMTASSDVNKWIAANADVVATIELS